ncbi:SRPBCC family protein [Nesterenkonia sp. E16_7]|uniref:SRPBCC family protein n=1 Tax=unclassified Nesterenkonia TaxID=2629769 RepID=UPI001A91696E|nr:MULTISPECIES: SRPBCC family protein [unclassified Nesterenkonia]MBO0594702.1 SRPBCC family protein [Nesterenkonia sp. E16_10]MBO0597451.1 SRPBCC family protein [Nesterenkonia sp. E16_7]
MTPPGRGWLANGLAGVRILGHLVTGPLLRRRRMSWGATGSEVAADWPGGELIPDPAWTATHAVTVAASPEQIWPWLAQLGQGRAGFYSFERLENLFGCQIRNVDRILPEHQDIAAAGEVRLAPQMAMRVARAQAAADLVLAADSPVDDARPGGTAAPAGVWSLHLRPAPDGGTRLIERLSYARPHSTPERIFGSRHLIEPISFVMSKEMLGNIRDLAQRRAMVSHSGKDHVQPTLV